MSDFLQMNLNRLNGIRNTTSRIADRQRAQNEARQQELYNAFTSGANVFNQTMAADKLAKAKAAEAAAARQAVTNRDATLNQYKKDAENRMRANYKNGIYRDPFTHETFTWNSPETFDMAVRSMQAKISSNIADRTAGKQEKSDFNGAFYNILRELAMVFPNGGLDPQTNMYNNDWMLKHKDAFRSSFDQYVRNGKYTPEEQRSLNQLLETYLNNYAPVGSEKPTSNNGFFRSKNSVSAAPVYDITTLGKGLSGGTPGGGGKASAAIANPNFINETINNASKNYSNTEIAKNPLSNVQPRSNMNPNVWSNMEYLLKQLVGDKDKMSSPEMQAYISDARDGEMRPSELQNFIKFLVKMGATPYKLPTKYY